MKTVPKLFSLYFVEVSAAILASAAIAKTVSVLAGQYGTDSDPVLWSLPTANLAVMVAALESLTALVLIRASLSTSIKLFLILLLASGFLAYRVTRFLVFGTVNCGCFGSLNRDVPLWSWTLDFVAAAALFLLLAGSIAGIFAMTKRDPAASPSE
jgi:hypothetical protein